MLLDPIQVYEGDGRNPYWDGYFHGHGISDRGFDDAWGFDIDNADTKGNGYGCGYEGMKNGGGQGINDTIIQTHKGDGIGDNNNHLGDGYGMGFENPGIQE